METTSILAYMNKSVGDISYLRMFIDFEGICLMAIRARQHPEPLNP